MNKARIILTHVGTLIIQSAGRFGYKIGDRTFLTARLNPAPYLYSSIPLNR